MSRIHVTIDRVVLHGVDPAERDALVTGMKAELARLLGDPSAAAAGFGSRRTPVLHLGQVPVEPGRSGAAQLGHQVARGIAKGVAG
jgi:hypothetical protein